MSLVNTQADMGYRQQVAAAALGRGVNSGDSEILWNMENSPSDAQFAQYVMERFGGNSRSAMAASPGVEADFWGGLGGAVKGFVTGGLGGAISGAITGSKGGPPAPPQPPGWTTGGMIPGTIGGIVGGIGGEIGSGIINRLTGAGTSSNGNGCACHSGRDSCTGQKMSSQPAPLATLFGGCCPPGRVLRRKPMGRDICIKKPRMNVLNPYALKRADRRVRGFAHQAKKMLGSFGYKVGKRQLATRKKSRRR